MSSVDPNLKLDTFGMVIRLNKGHFFDGFSELMKKYGFEQQFFTVGRMTATDTKGNKIESGLQNGKNTESSDQYNLHGKYCSVYPHGDQIIIHRNFHHDGCLAEKKIPSLIDEIKMVLENLSDTIPKFHEETSECDLLAVFQIADKTRLEDGARLFEDSVFGKMEVKRNGAEIILNPDILEDKTPDEINELSRTRPELLSRKLGWNQIKVKNTDTPCQVNFEYKDINAEKILEMMSHPHSYLLQIVRRADMLMP